MLTECCLSSTMHLTAIKEGPRVDFPVRESELSMLCKD